MAGRSEGAAPNERTSLLQRSIQIRNGAANFNGVSLYQISGEKKIAVFCICLTEFFERLAYYGVVANLVLYCTNFLGMNNADATTVNYVFTGVLYILTLFGGLIADLQPGKYWTIIISGLIYLIGLTLLTPTVTVYAVWFDSKTVGHTCFFVALSFVALGSGGMRANLGPFGAQQVEEYGSQSIQSFFNWFYWSINAGALAAYTAVAYVQQYVGFQWGYLILLAGMVVGIAVFILPRKLYRRGIGESIISKSFLVCRAGCRGFKRPAFDNARVSQGGTVEDDMVDGVVGLLRILPILAFFIIYFTVYSQMSTSFLLQSERLDISLGEVEFPVAMLVVFNNVIILLLIPIMDCFVYPLFVRVGWIPKYLRRIGIGFFIAIFAVIAAGVLEIYRKQEIVRTGGIEQIVFGANVTASHITMFTQVPQFALVGLSEVFCVISGLEFAYLQAPMYMQSVVTGLFLVAQGLGSFAALVIVSVASSNTDWYTTDINDGKMENLLFLLAGIAGFNFLLYSVVARFFKTRNRTAIILEEATA